MIPKAEEIKKVSEQIIHNWHIKEDGINSINNAIELLISSDSNNILHHIEILSIINTYLWHEEDKARDLCASDADIAGVKKLIDKINALRVNKIEEIDDIVYLNLDLNENAPLNSETIGSIIDRITILALKRYHMAFETNRTNSSDELRNKCVYKLDMINKQMDDLISAYNFLISEIKSGERRFALYKQFKMYNDPDLNPVLYKKKKNNS